MADPTPFLSLLGHVLPPQVWDHIITNDTSFLYYLIVAIFRRLRHPVLCAGKDGKAELLVGFFRRQQPLDVNKVLREKAHWSLRCFLPADAAVALNRELDSLPHRLFAWRMK